MPEFLNLIPPDEALDKFLGALSFSLQSEIVPVPESLGRVVFSPVTTGTPMPEFRRSTVDGFAVRAEDTYGASDGLPAYLPLIGEVRMGRAPDFSLQPGQCAVIHTGGMLPEGANAVIMIEYTQQAREDEVELLRPVAVGENVIEIGEDVAAGEEVIPVGRLVRPAEIGGMMALGVTEVKVARPPLVGIMSSGDEVVSPDKPVQPGQVRDINSFTLKALVERAGGRARLYGVSPDNFDKLAALAAQAHRECDLVVITAGSSASVRDLTAQVIDALGKPGVLVHGVSVRPGKPTILGVCDGKPVVGLPGNPVSALVIAGLFVTPVIYGFLGREANRIPEVVDAVLTVNLASQAGREDFVAVSLEEKDGQFLAEPVYGKSNLIFTHVRAHGLVRVAADANGLPAGMKVRVWKI
jgi:molybdopterin molybdotransferase